MFKKVLGRYEIWAFGLLTLVMIASPVNGISCQDVTAKLLPCKQFLMGNGDITVPCCDGAQELQQVVVSRSERRDICLCLKQAAISIGVNLIKPQRAKKLPDLCQINVPTVIDPNIDCDKLRVPILNNSFMTSQKTQNKDLVIKAFRPTSPGDSPGIGHKQKPPSPQVHNKDLVIKAFRPTSPGDSPGIGHKQKPPSPQVHN